MALLIFIFIIKIFIINKKDGETIIIDKKKYVKKDKTGNEIESAKIDGYRAKVGEAQGQSISLVGFTGDVEKNDIKGKYYIPIREVEEIIFK